MFDNLVAHVDSQVALKLTQDVASTPTELQTALLSEPDLGRRLWLATRVGHYEFCKVDAHKEADTNVSELTRYHRLGNKVANDSAVAACKHLFPPLVKQAQTIALDMSKQERLLRRYFGYVLDLMKARAILDSAAAVEPQHTTVRLSSAQQCQQYTVDDPWEPIMPGHDLTRHFALGPTWADRFGHWLMELRWPPREEGSYLQTRYSKMWLPLRRADDSGVVRLIAFDSYEHLQSYDGKFAELADMTSILFKQFGNLHDGLLMPEMKRGLVKSLYVQGADIWSSGLSRRPTLPYQHQLAEILASHFQKHRSTSMSCIPQLPFEVDGSAVRQSRLEMAPTWIESGKRVAAATKKIRRHRDPTQTVLSF